jgi:hypothetical protein
VQDVTEEKMIVLADVLDFASNKTNKTNKNLNALVTNSGSICVFAPKTDAVETVLYTA